MWCPKCKNEYVEGITHCADCGMELVESLNAKVSQEENAFEASTIENASFADIDSNAAANAPVNDTAEDFEEDTASDSEQPGPEIPDHASVSKKTKKEDNK